MAFRSALVLLLVAGSCYSAKLPSRIIGGEPTTIENYPSLVQVERILFFNIWLHSCGASILTSRILLTAAHCLGDDPFIPEWVRIRAGSTFSNIGGQVVGIQAMVNHPTFGTNGLEGDIGLVWLSSSLIYSPVVQQATIVPQGTIIPDNSAVVHAGWGNTVEGALFGSLRLRDVTIYTINNRLCYERYQTLDPPATVTESMICAGILDVGGKDACQGDSGGPMYYQNLLVGIVSWGHGCGNDTYPGISTRIASYTDWIVDNAVHY